ncbi:ROK family transcriptional regulator [Paenibacillus sp. FSL R7-0297]|uniref:ROK family transcriptional regulator n=1 Tax=unclassified Paenibacillus TaxID=185978 RepID=UPI0004F93135|nr:ROK family transcriptional regulator [Paenibacillus sp. FSL R5-0912]AIQ41944.1 ROK family transcriptional regulator [Paenibacillus sp. FSL R5-0912]
MQKIGGNALVIREVNINLVRQVLKERGQATKRQIAEYSGLSIVTVGTVLQILMERNEVTLGGQVSSSGGRPSQQYIYNEEFALALIVFTHEEQNVIYIHRTIVTLAGRCLFEDKTAVLRVDLAAFETVIDSSLQMCPAIQAIGLGLPGAEVDGKMIVSDYDALLGVPVAEHFRQRYGKPVVIENDVNAAVIGYCRRMKEEEGSVIYLYFPDRFEPGAGIFINGKLYKGKRGFAGEVANIPLGIPWGDPRLISSFAELTDAIARLAVAVSSVLNPDAVILYGSFLNEGHLQALAEKCGALLPDAAIPRVLLSEDFAADYIQGMIVQTLGTLEQGLKLTKSEGQGGY